MTSYTPGPWRAMEPLPPSYSDHGYRAIARVRELMVYAEASNMLTTDEKGTHFKWGDNMADARLIAAAPELLAALHKAVEIIKVWHNCDEVWDIYFRSSPEMAPIRAALTKAVDARDGNEGRGG